MQTQDTVSLVVVSLRTQDLHASVHFFRDVIGLRLMQHHGSYPTFDLGSGAHLVIIKGNPLAEQNENTQRFPVIAFSVPNLEASVASLIENGVELPWGIETSESAHYVMFHDPGGNLIELAEFD